MCKYVHISDKLSTRTERGRETEKKRERERERTVHVPC